MISYPKWPVKFESVSFIILDLSEPFTEPQIPLLTELIDAYQNGLLAQDDTTYECYLSKAHSIAGKTMFVRGTELPGMAIIRDIARRHLMNIMFPPLNNQLTNE